jgi:hyperosmotically inducible periplasmic protein
MYAAVQTSLEAHENIRTHSHNTKEKTMKIKFAATCLAIGICFTPIVGHAEDSTTAKTYVKDSVITAKIKAKLAEDKMSTLTNIQVDTDDSGVVWLSGTAKTKEDADKAHSIAHSTEGVKSVKNHIKVKKDD